MAGPLLVVDAPSMLFRAFYALPKTITGRRRAAGERAARHREPDPARGRDAPAARRRPLLRAGRRRLPGRALPGYHAERGPRCRRSCAPQFDRRAARSSAPSAGRSPTTSSLEADDLLGTFARPRPRPGGRALLLTGDRDMFQCAADAVTVLYVQHRRQGGRAGRPGRGRGALRHRARAGPRLHRPARRPLRRAARARRASGEKTAAELLREHGSLEASSTRRSAIARPKLRTALIEPARGAARVQRHRDAARRRRRPAARTRTPTGKAPPRPRSNWACGNSPSD